VALADILNRIDVDANSEAQAVVDAAQAETDRLLEDARSQADDAADALVRAAAREASLEAQTMLANARLQARDSLLSAKREVLDRALVLLEERIVGMTDAGYTEFLARAIVAAARGGERVMVAAADATRLAGLSAAVAANAGGSLVLVYDDTPSDIEHGVMLLGDRDSVDLSIAGIIDGQREELLMRLAARVFGDEEAHA